MADLAVNMHEKTKNKCVFPGFYTAKLAMFFSPTIHHISALLRLEHKSRLFCKQFPFATTNSDICHILFHAAKNMVFLSLLFT